MNSNYSYLLLIVLLVATSACPIIHKPYGGVSEYGHSLRIDLCDGTLVDEYICRINTNKKAFEISAILITNADHYQEEHRNSHTMLEFSIEDDFSDSISKSVLILDGLQINGVLLRIGATSYFVYEVPLNVLLKDENTRRFDFIIDLNDPTLDQKKYKVSFF